MERGRRTTQGRGGLLRLRSLAFYLLLRSSRRPRVQAAPASPIAARPTSRRYIGFHSVGLCQPAHLHEPRPWETRQRKRWRWKQRSTGTYRSVRQARLLHQGGLLKTPHSLVAGGYHPCPSVLGDILLVPVILFLTLLSRFPLEW